MTKPIKIMKKFRVGYSVKWNFNGILEVEAENADDAEKKAEAKLDEMAENDEFDDVSNFKAEFDGADVLDVEEVKDYASERRYAEYIAALSSNTIDGREAAKRVANAVVHCKAHPIVCEGNGLISFDYDNSFGPTTTVNDVLERMNMRDWRVACDEFCKYTLRKGGFDPENFDWPTPLPHVMKVPEDGGTDVIARVCVSPSRSMRGRTVTSSRSSARRTRTRTMTPPPPGRRSARTATRSSDTRLRPEST